MYAGMFVGMFVSMYVCMYVSMHVNQYVYACICKYEGFLYYITSFSLKKRQGDTFFNCVRKVKSPNLL